MFNYVNTISDMSFCGFILLHNNNECGADRVCSERPELGMVPRPTAVLSCDIQRDIQRFYIHF